jgi:hypothetical protein
VSDPHFIIYASSFNEAVGGTLVLHELCARLNRLGYRASIWPAGKLSSLSRIEPRALFGYLRRGGARGFDPSPHRNPIASKADLDGAIVVYPEVVSGNPLGGGRVVRWLLNKPGFFFPSIRFGQDDAFFFFMAAFNDPAINPNPDNLLRVMYRHPAYRRINVGPREGACYIVRKGAGRPLDRHPPGAVAIDAMSHEEKAATFNRCSTLYSYDPYTFYTSYAAICGCVPIVVPMKGVSKSEWVGEPVLALGHAYGDEEAEVEWAIATRGAMLEALDRRFDEDNELVHRFVKVCLEHFDRRSGPDE